MIAGLEKAGDGIIVVRPVLVQAPVFWEPEWWSPSSHALDEVHPEMPLDEKPFAELEISLDVTLQEVFEAACDAWNLKAGPDLKKYGGELSNEFQRFAFVHPDRDTGGIEQNEVYGWPSRLPIARESGAIESISPLQVTYRELLASSEVGLLDGDVTRPYVDPVRPQGSGQLVELAHLAVRAVRDAYAAVDDSVGYAEHTIRLIRASLPETHRVTDRVIDEGVRIGAVVAFVRWIRRKLRHRRSPRDHPS
jgi:hypothetical protein